MTDEIQNEAPVEPSSTEGSESASDQPMQTPPTPAEMRHVLLKTVKEVYSSLLGVLEKLPIHQQVKLNALTRFDEGLMWTIEGISMINFNPPASEEKPQEETKTENQSTETPENPVADPVPAS